MSTPVGASVTHTITSPESIADEVGEAFVLLSERLIEAAQERQDTSGEARIAEPFVDLSSMRFATKFRLDGATVKVVLSGVADVRSFEEVDA